MLNTKAMRHLMEKHRKVVIKKEVKQTLKILEQAFIEESKKGIFEYTFIPESQFPESIIKILQILVKKGYTIDKQKEKYLISWY